MTKLWNWVLKPIIWFIGIGLVLVLIGFVYSVVTNFVTIGYNTAQSIWATPTSSPTMTATASATATATASATATATASATATATATKAKASGSGTKATAAKVVKPTSVVVIQQPVVATAVPMPTVLTGDEGPCQGGTQNIHFAETREGRGNSGFLAYQIDIAPGEVGLLWGSEIPGFGTGRSFVTIAGPWKGTVGIFNGAVREGQVLTDLTQVQKFWGRIIDCDIQRAIPLKDQKNGLYTQYKLNW